MPEDSTEALIQQKAANLTAALLTSFTGPEPVEAIREAASSNKPTYYRELAYGEPDEHGNLWPEG